MGSKDVSEIYRISDSVWEQIEPLLPPELPGFKGGPPQMDHRRAMEAILYVLHTGCKWKEIPHSLGASSTIYARYRKWRKAGVFQRMWRTGLLKYDEFRTLFWYDKPWMRR
jgi:putative transposase